MPSLGSIWFDIEVKLDSLRKGVTEAQKQITEADKSFQKTMGSISNGFDSVGKTLTKTGKTMSLAVSLPLAGAGAAAIKAAGDFESMGYTFQAVSGATGEQMAKMSQLAKELGNDITLPGTSATDAAAAMTELAKAGLSIDDTFKAVKATLQLSAAAQIENAEAATIVGQSLNAFGLSGDKAIKVADLLANSANASAGEITDMAYAMQAGASVANMAGQSIEDFTTAISLMANAGVTGSDAGTSLKSMFMSLISPTDKAAKTMKQYGLNVYDANGQLKPLPELVSLFSSKLGGMTDQQRNATLATIFGSDAIRAANIVLIEGADKWDDMSTAVNRAGGAQDVAASKMKGFNGAMEAFKSTVETLAITIGEKFLPKLTPLVGKLTEVVDKFGSLSPAMQDNIIKYGMLAAAIGPTLIVLGTLSSSISKVIKAVGGMAKAAGSVIKFGGSIVKGIAGIPEKFDTLYLKALYAKDAIGNFATKLGEGATAVFNFGKNLVGDVINGISSFGSKIGEAVTSIGSFASKLAVDAYNAIASFGTKIGEAAASVASFAAKLAVDAAKAISGFAVQLATTAWSAITSFVGAMGGAIASAWSFTAALLANPITWIVAAILGLIAVIILLWKNWDDVSKFLTETWNKIKEVGETVWNGLKDFFAGVWEAITAKVKEVWNGIKEFLSGLWEGIKATASSIWEGIKNAIIAPINAARTLLTQVWNAIKKFVSDLWNSIKSKASEVWEGIKNAVMTPINSAKKLLSDAWNSIKETATNLWSGLKTKAGEIWEGIKTAVMTPINSVKKLLSDVWNGITKTASDAWNGLKKTASDIFSKVKDAILAPFKNLHIPLPHFSFSIKHTKIAGINVPYPDVSVNWYKQGGIFTRPSIIGVGEAGTEVVAPLDELESMLTDALKKMNMQSSAPTVIVQNMTVRNDEDIYRISRELNSLIQSSNRARGVR
jgi:TP901 family phage tail tape measure protein